MSKLCSTHSNHVASDDRAGIIAEMKVTDYGSNENLS